MKLLKFNRTYVVLLCNFFVLTLATIFIAGCASHKPTMPLAHTTSVEQSTPENTPMVCPPPIPTETNPYTGNSTWEEVEEISDNHLPISSPPNLWTRIKGENITIFPYDYVSDFTYDANGSLWMVGGFGVIKKDMDGQQVWYSMKNGLPTNRYTSIAISPSGDVWVGGANNVLLRFDGQQWINEGESFPLPYDSRMHYLCYSKRIEAIDFDSNGSVWVMNGGIEIYHRVGEGQWVDVQFPKSMLPIAGGGACPVGFRVQSADNIIVEIGPY